MQFPRIVQERGETYVVCELPELYIFHADRCGKKLESGNRPGAHDLRRDKELHTIDDVFGDKSGVEARAGFSEERENALCAELVENLGERNAAAICRKDFYAYAASSKFVRFDLVGGNSEDKQIVLR